MDVGHLVDGEEEPGRVAHAEHQHDAHEDDGEVVLLLPPDRRLRLVRGRRGGRRGGGALPHRHLTLVAVLHVLVDLVAGKINSIQGCSVRRRLSFVDNKV